MAEKIDTTGNAEINNVRFSQQTSHPSNPSSGHVGLYIISGSAHGGLYMKDSSGREIGPFITGSSGGGTFTDYSATSTVVGWAATPTVQIWTFKNGRLVTVMFYITGTSNNATTSFTVPNAVAAASNAVFIPCVQSVDNGSGVATPGRVELTGGSATINLNKSPDGTAYTGTGTKTVRGSFSYFTD